MRFENKKGLTLTEIITVVAVIGVASLFVHAVFIQNWSYYTDRIARADMWSDANRIVESMTDNGRQAAQIDVSAKSDDEQTATMIAVDGSVIGIYRMTNNGRFEVEREDGLIKMLSENIDYENTEFMKDGEALLIDLALADTVFARRVNFVTSTEIYPRN